MAFVQEKPSVRKFDSRNIPLPRTEVVFEQSDEPTDLEIGCGVGYHPIQYCLANPDRRLYAIERTKTRFALFASRMRRHDGIDNLIPVRCDAVNFITHQIPRESIDRIFLLYPNPYPKSLNRRWHAMPFMHRLLESLKSGGEITLATNVESYFDEAKLFFKDFWQLQIVESRPTNANVFFPRTHFERKYLQRGETCFNLVAKKN